MTVSAANLGVPRTLLALREEEAGEKKMAGDLVLLLACQGHFGLHHGLEVR